MRERKEEESREYKRIEKKRRSMRVSVGEVRGMKRKKRT